MPTNIVSMNRGDTYTLYVDAFLDVYQDEEYTLTDNDAIYFGLMDPNQHFEDALVRKKLTAADLEDPQGPFPITLEPEDTVDLMPGRYYYMVKLKQDHIEHYDDPTMPDEHIQSVTTIIDKSKFVIYD